MLGRWEVGMGGVRMACVGRALGLRGACAGRAWGVREACVGIACSALLSGYLGKSGHLPRYSLSSTFLIRK